MSSLVNAARMHRRQFETFVDQTGTTVEVRPPASRTAAVSVADKVLGKQSVETGVGTSLFITAIWNADIATGAVPAYNIPNNIAALGRAEKVDAVLRAKLADALDDPSDKFGRTIFDTAKDVVYGGYRWTVTGTARTGLAPEGPYILWIAVKKVGES